MSVPQVGKQDKRTHRSLFMNLKWAKLQVSWERSGTLGLGVWFCLSCFQCFPSPTHRQCSAFVPMNANKGINLFQRAGFIIL